MGRGITEDIGDNGVSEVKEVVIFLLFGVRNRFICEWGRKLGIVF